jgi:hypothetical protein
MGKSYRHDSKNERWRKAKQQKSRKSNKLKLQPFVDDDPRQYPNFEGGS